MCYETGKILLSHFNYSMLAYLLSVVLFVPRIILKLPFRLCRDIRIISGKQRIADCAFLFAIRIPALSEAEGTRYEIRANYGLFS